VHEQRWDPRTQELDIDSRLMPITDEIPDHPATLAEVERWLAAGWAGFREAGFDPEALVTSVADPLDGLESSVRNRPTTLTRLITAGMRAEVPGSDVAILNAGSIRIDDVIPPGPVTQYDVIRALPFGGPVVEVRMRGDLLARVLDQGERNVTGGGFLLTDGAERAGEGWLLGASALDPQADYTVAIADFLLTGREQGLEFLTADAPGLTVVDDRRDVRQVLIDALRERYGAGD
jgi:5'-nucleotidase